MDPLSIATGCVSLILAIRSCSALITDLVRGCRAARQDLDDISQELTSVESVLSLLKDDIDTTNDQAIPETLRRQITSIICNCSRVLKELDELLQRHNGERMDQAAYWATVGKRDAAKLRGTLEAHKGALNLALEFLTLYVYLRDHYLNWYVIRTIDLQRERLRRSRKRSRTILLQSSRILRGFSNKSSSYVLSYQLENRGTKALILYSIDIWTSLLIMPRQFVTAGTRVISKMILPPRGIRS